MEITEGHGQRRVVLPALSLSKGASDLMAKGERVEGHSLVCSWQATEAFRVTRTKEISASYALPAPKSTKAFSEVR